MAGYTNPGLVGEMHAFRATDPREKDIAEGHNPIQVGPLHCGCNTQRPPDRRTNKCVSIQIILDQAAHMMDAVALGEFAVLLTEYCRHVSPNPLMSAQRNRKLQRRLGRSTPGTGEALL
jgi:hypothetical protein